LISKSTQFHLGYLFLAPGQVHDLSITDENSQVVLLILIRFFSSFLNKSQCIDQLPLFSFNRSVSYYQIPKDEVCKFREIFMKIKNINEENNRNAENLLRIYLLELFYTVLNEISDSTENTNITNQKNLIFRFEKLVEENYATEHYPKFYADKLAITANYLNYICKNISGKTAGEIIRNRIILEAKRLLINSEFSISQISFQLGFEDNSYFTKFFKTNSNFAVRF
jgi:AraC-like DNA-binding protein